MAFLKMPFLSRNSLTNLKYHFPVFIDKELGHFPLR